MKLRTGLLLLNIFSFSLVSLAQPPEEKVTVTAGYDGLVSNVRLPEGTLISLVEYSVEVPKAPPASSVIVKRYRISETEMPEPRIQKIGPAFMYELTCLDRKSLPDSLGFVSQTLEHGGVCDAIVRKEVEVFLTDRENGVYESKKSILVERSKEAADLFAALNGAREARELQPLSLSHTRIQAPPMQNRIQRSDSEVSWARGTVDVLKKHIGKGESENFFQAHQTKVDIRCLAPAAERQIVCEIAVK